MFATSRIFLIMLIPLVLNIQLANAKQTYKPPFFQVNINGKQAYILGSIHIGSADMYPLPAQINAALAQSDALVMEVDIGNTAEIAPLLKKYGVQKQKIDKQTAHLLDTFCLKEMDCTGLSELAPWLQAVNIMSFRYQQLNLNADYGVEAYILSQKGNRQLFALESAQMQFELLSSFSAVTQWQMVRDSIEVSDYELKQLPLIWRSGDNNALAMLIQEQTQVTGSDDVLEKLLYQRNESMATEIKSLLETYSGTLFITVGAGHVVGQKSIIDHLEQLGLHYKNCWEQQCNISK